MISLIQRILNISGNQKKRILAAFVFSFLKSMLHKAPLALAYLTLSAFYYGTITEKQCLQLAVLLILCVLIEALFQNLADRLQGASGYMIFYDLRLKLGAHLKRMPMGYFTEGNIGKISSVLSVDMVFIEENCMTVIADMMSYFFAEIFFLLFLFWMDPLLGALGILFALAIGGLGKAMKNEMLKCSDIRQKQSEKLTSAVLEHTEGIGIIKSCSLMGEKSKQLSENFEASCKSSLDFEEQHCPWQRRLYLLCALGSTVILAAALLLNQAGKIEAIVLIGLLLYILDLFAPLKALYSQSTRLTVMNSCLNRIEEVFQSAELNDSGSQRLPSRETVETEIEFDHVSFGYNQKEILHDLSFTLGKNQMLALVGPSGSGKTTIANLLMRFWDIQKGSIKLRGTDIREIPLKELTSQISTVFQRVYLFEDTIEANIRMGRPEATLEEVIDAAKKARCYDFIMALPEGFKTKIQEGGATLSGGEKQRISIARCILKDAPIILLDEATASVDADNENLIQEAISELCRGKTLIVIAHRLNTIQNADQILVIDKGRLVQQGTHQQLIQQSGLYRDFLTLRQNSLGWNRRSLQ